MLLMHAANCKIKLMSNRTDFFLRVDLYFELLGLPTQEKASHFCSVNHQNTSQIFLGLAQ